MLDHQQRWGKNRWKRQSKKKSALKLKFLLCQFTSLLLVGKLFNFFGRVYNIPQFPLKEEMDFICRGVKAALSKPGSAPVLKLLCQGTAPIPGVGGAPSSCRASKQAWDRKKISVGEARSVELGVRGRVRPEISPVSGQEHRESL